MGDAPLRRLLDLIARAKAFLEPCCNPGEHTISQGPQTDQALMDWLNLNFHRQADCSKAVSTTYHVALQPVTSEAGCVLASSVCPAGRERVHHPMWAAWNRPAPGFSGLHASAMTLQVGWA